MGISSYKSQRTREAVEIMKALVRPLLIHQPSYSMLNRWVEMTYFWIRWMMLVWAPSCFHHSRKAC